MIYEVDRQHTWVIPGPGMASRWPTPAGALADPRFLLSTIAYRTGDGEATVVLQAPVNWSGVEECGWIAGKVEEGSAWRSFEKDGTRVNVCTPSEYRAGVTSDNPIMHDPYSLASWLEHTGTHYYATPGVGAVANIRHRFDGSEAQPRWRLIDQTHMLPWVPPGRIEMLDWKTRGWHPNRISHKWDLRAAFLAAMAAVELPFRQLVNTGPTPETRKCGYYRIRAPEGQPGWVLPHPDRQGTSWVCQATLERYPEAVIVDSWTPAASLNGLPGHRRILRQWAEDWRDMMADNPESVLAERIWKDAYAQLVGLMNVQSGQIFRPDWRNMIIDHVRASIARRVLKVYVRTGHWPIRINHDAVYYATPVDLRAYTRPEGTETITPAEVWFAVTQENLGVGPHIGNMRYEGIDRGKP